VVSTTDPYGRILGFLDRRDEQTNKQKQTPWSEPASELYRPSDRRMLAKSVPTFADGGRRVVSAANPLRP
jgi:hypothetical protein